MWLRAANMGYTAASVRVAGTVDHAQARESRLDHDFLGGCSAGPRFELSDTLAVGQGGEETTEAAGPCRCPTTLTPSDDKAGELGPVEAKALFG